MAEALSFPHQAGRDALERLRGSLDEAITSTPLDPEAWKAHLSAVLTRLGRIFRKHVTETEAPDGSLDDVMRLKPYLQPRVLKIKDEHVSLRDRIDQLNLAAKVCGATDVTIEDMRVEAGRLADAIRQHQAAGVDLVYEAYLREDGMG